MANRSETLSDVVQKAIDTSFGKDPWKPSKGWNLRETARTMILEAFLKQNSPSIDQERAEVLTWAIEQRVCESYFVFRYHKYARQIRSLFFHISRNPNRFYKMDPCLVGTMSTCELAQDLENVSRKRKRDDEEIVQEDIFKGRSEHQCRKCKGFDTSFYERYLRSADEGAIVFFRCNNPKCRNKWKQ